jgi:flagellar hook-associated protein 3 FlgL
MRISTAMIFDAGVSSMNRQSTSLLQLQQQLSTGRRMVTPSDDPVAAAQALVVSQAQDITTQYSANQSAADSALGLSDAALSGTSDLLIRVRQLAVQAGNGTLAASDRRSIAQELRSNFDQLVGLANTTDGSGQYLYSGYMGSTKPFNGSVATGVTYSGDNGQRTTQVSASRQLAISDSGSSVFQRIANGNGSFTTAYSGTNTGTGVIDGGAVTNPAAWSSVVNKNINVNFYVDNTQTPPVTYYDLVNGAGAGAGISLLTGAAAVVPTFTVGGPAPGGLRVYTSGQAIPLNNLWAGPIPAAITPSDYGIQVTLTGSPATNDSFAIAASSSQSVFTTIANLINAVENTQTSTAAGGAALSNQIGFALTNLDQAHNNILNVRAQLGSRLNEVTALGSSNSAESLQYQQTLSNLQDLDYAKAISDYTKNQMVLTAAQKSYQSIAQLSLFNYLP